MAYEIHTTMGSHCVDDENATQGTELDKSEPVCLICTRTTVGELKSPVLAVKPCIGPQGDVHEVIT